MAVTLLVECHPRDSSRTLGQLVWFPDPSAFRFRGGRAGGRESAIVHGLL